MLLLEGLSTHFNTEIVTWTSLNTVNQYNLLFAVLLYNVRYQQLLCLQSCHTEQSVNQITTKLRSSKAFKQSAVLNVLITNFKIYEECMLYVWHCTLGTAPQRCNAAYQSEMSEIQ